MSTYKSIDDIIKEIENWLRLSALLHSGLKESLLAILHNDQNDPTYKGLPRDPTDLYNELNTTHKAAITALKNGRPKRLSQEQYDKLLPNSGTTDSENFDITLIVILIINLTGIPPPATGWNHRILPGSDNSKAANVIRVREWRNFIHHTEPNSIDNATFTNKWKEGVTIINTLGYNFDSNKLLNCSLDSKILQQQSLLFKALDDFCKNEVLCHGKNIKEMQQTIKLHKNKLSDLDNQMKTIQTDVGNLDVQLQTNSSLTAEQNREMKSVKTDVGNLNLQLQTNSSLIGEQNREMKSVKTDVGKLNLQLQTNSSLTAEQNREMKSVKTDVGNLNLQLQTNSSLIAEQIRELKSVKTDVGNFNLQLQTNSSLTAEQNREMKSVKTDVGNLNLQLQTNSSLTAEQNSEIKSMQADFNFRLKQLESTKKECIGKKMDGNNSKELMEVISYLPNGCVFKIKVKPSYQIHSVKIRCITTNYESDVIDVKQYQEFNDGDSKNVYDVYEVKDLNDETMLLKIGNLKGRRTYEIQLDTNQHQYVGEVTIPDSASCTHVTNIDGKFIVLTPPLGQENEPLNCRQGLRGHIVNDSDELTICISDGAGVKKMTVKDFDLFSRVYLNRNFPKSERVFVVFPLIRMISDHNTQQVAKIFYKLLLTRNNFRSVITNLNSKKYIECFAATDEIAHEELPYHNRLQVFDQTTASILNIRVINSTNLNEDVHKEMERCVMDLQYFVSSQRHHLCNCYVIGVLAFPNLCRVNIESHVAYYNLKESRHMKLFYLSKEDVQNVDNLQHWWSNTFEGELKKFDDHISDFNEDLFIDICAQSIATIALTEISPNLPTLGNNSYRQIISLLLNVDQMEAIQSQSNRKIIFGNYGSGKSIVLEEIAKRRFYENLHTTVKVLILYVIWEEFSLVEITKKMLLDELENDDPDGSPYLTMTSGNVHQIWNDLKKEGEVKFLGFLHHFLEESGYQTVHILIDELPTDVIEITEVEDINKLFKRHPESSVTIAPQSIIIDRRTSTNDEEVNHNRNGLDQLEMDRFELVKVMRNTIQINAVVNASQIELEGIETSLSIYDPSLVNVTMEPPRKKQKNQKKRKESEEKQKTAEEKQKTTEETPSMVSQSQGSVPMPAPKLEQIAKFVDTDEPTKDATSIIKSKYLFNEIQNGNGVEDQKPTLIKLPSIVDFESEMSAKILKELLQKVCLKKSAQTMILCNSMNEIRQVSFCLSQIPDFKFITYIPQLQGVFPNTDEKLNVFSKFNEGSCLLTNNNGIKGMEAKRVIIFASQYEHFQMHHFTETISRGNVWCYVLLHSSGKNKVRKTLGDIINELEGTDLVDVRQVKMCKDYKNFGTPMFEVDSIYKVNEVCLMKQKFKKTFKDYKVTFDNKNPVKQNEEDYRRFLFTMANVGNEKGNEEKNYSIFHEFHYEGKQWSFRDVRDLLRNKDYTTFGKMFNHNRNILNYMRSSDEHYNDTFLIDASMMNRVDVVEHLINKFKDDIDVWVVNKRGLNAYHRAAMLRNVDVMKHLLSCDRSGLDVGDNDGLTPLHWAGSNKPMVNLLLDAGASVDVVDNEGRTPDRHTTVDVEIKKIIQDHRTKSSS